MKIILTEVHKLSRTIPVTSGTKLQIMDQIMEVATPSISNVTAVEQLYSEIADLKRLVQSLLTSKALHHRRSPSRRQSPSPSLSRPNKETCWYRQCQPPCNMSGKPQASH